MLSRDLDPETAQRFADLAIANVVREYPGKPDHVLGGDADLKPPRLLHPAFFGSFDWHSAVHMHWLLVHLRRRFSLASRRPVVDALLDRHLTAEAIAAECAYLDRLGTQAFERTYGWAWLLKLADELALSGDVDATRWAATLAPLARKFVARYLAYLPAAQYPIRYGIHSNSAFGLALGLDYARRAGERELEALCSGKARAWYEGDRDAPAQWEPSGADFLSPALMESDLMRRVVTRAKFASWLSLFLPRFAQRQPAALFEPVPVADRSDPQMVHLDGLNLSRAWNFLGIAGALPAGDARIAVAAHAAVRHRAAGFAGLDSTDYVGSHWLATFAALALGG